jgi:hypothetical protein
MDKKMSKKVITAIVVIAILVLVALAVIYAPSMMETMRRLHGIR